MRGNCCRGFCHVKKVWNEEVQTMSLQSPQADDVSGVPALSEEAEVPPVLLELSKKIHFCRFLEREMVTARTEAEKEAVETVLVKTRTEIRDLKREWMKLQEGMESASVEAMAPDLLPDLAA